MKPTDELPVIFADQLQSLNYDGPDGGETFADAGTLISLVSGDITSTGLVVDGTTGDVWIRGDIEATAFVLDYDGNDSLRLGSWNDGFNIVPALEALTDAGVVHTRLAWSESSIFGDTDQTALVIVQPLPTGANLEQQLQMLQDSSYVLGGVRQYIELSNSAGELLIDSYSGAPSLDEVTLRSQTDVDLTVTAGAGATLELTAGTQPDRGSVHISNGGSWFDSGSPAQGEIMLTGTDITFWSGPATGGSATNVEVARIDQTYENLRCDWLDNLGGQQLILTAGEARTYQSGLTGEAVYIVGESGLQVIASPDNWGSGWAGRVTPLKANATAVDITVPLDCTDTVAAYGTNDPLAPGFAFVDDTDTGMYKQSSNVLAWSTGGVKRALLYSGGFRLNVSGSLSLPAIHFEGDTNTGLRRATTDAVEIVVGGVRGVYVNDSQACWIPGVYAQTTASAANVHIVDANGALQRSTSSARYKRDVEPVDQALARRILAELRPVWYRSTCDADPDDWSWWGLIAEEVAAVDPRLVSWAPTPGCGCEHPAGAEAATLDPSPTWHADGCLRPEGVAYDRIVPLLLATLVP